MSAEEQDPQTGAEGQEASQTDQGDSAVTEPSASAQAAASAEPQKEALFLEDGRSIRVDQAEMRHWAQQGLRAAARDVEKPGDQAASEPAASATAEAAAPEEAGDEEDPVAKQLGQLTKKLDTTTKQLTELQQHRQKREQSEKKAQEQAQQRQRLDAMLEKHAKGADAETRQEIEDKAARLLTESAEGGTPITVEQAIAAGAKRVGGRQAEKNRGWLKGKKTAQETAAEAPGGAATVSSVSTGAPPTKDEQRKAAREMTDGTAERKAMEVFREVSSGAEAR